jgi:glycosyltransferase involved in cell wall biosynthesis
VKIGVYHEPAGGLGGAEAVSAAIAAALRERHAVTLLHHHPDLTRERLAEFVELDLGGVEVRDVPKPEKGWQAWDGPAWRLGRELRAWQAELSRGYDLFVASTHGVPPFNNAGSGALYVHFPLFDRRAGWPWADAAPGELLRRARSAARRWLHGRLWRERFAGYAVKLANSRFTADRTRERWGVECSVVYPPVRTDGFPEVPKRDTIAAVGRFAPIKRQLDLVKAFRERVAPRLPGWELVCVGTVGPPEERDYFREVEAAAVGAPVRLLTDASTADLRRVLAGAKVFWHAAGFGVDPLAEPHRLEHFGIATVEAMAAGCVPVVPNLGGQPEIVRPGEDGFLCGSVEELVEATLKLAADDVRMRKLSASAREQARRFGRERFADEMVARLSV